MTVAVCWWTEEGEAEAVHALVGGSPGGARFLGRSLCLVGSRLMTRSQAQHIGQGSRFPSLHGPGSGSRGRSSG